MHCLICQSTFPQFEDYGLPPRNGKCPVCGAKARHRELGWFFENYLKFPEGSKVLEVGPSKVQAKYFVHPRFLGSAKYTGVDVRTLKHHQYLQPPHRFLEMDVTRLSFSDQSFDVILCNHVLPFIRSDYLAMSEIHRCLKPKGMAILNVAITLPKTRRASEMAAENPKVYTDEYRTENGSEWVYGEDYFERLVAAGFFYHRLGLYRLAPEATRLPQGFREDSELLLCFKFQDEMERFLEGVTHS